MDSVSPRGKDINKFCGRPLLMAPLGIEELIAYSLLFAQGKHSSSFRCRVVRVVLYCMAFVLVALNKFMATLEVSLTTVHAPGQTTSKQSKSQLTEPNLMRHPVLLMSTKVVKDHRRSEDSSVMIKCQSTYPTVRWTTWR